MAITQAMCTTFKVNLMKGDEDFDVDSYYIALYTSSASLSDITTVYTTSGEVTGTGYTAGGKPLTVSTAPTSSGTTAYIDFSDVVWSSATITAAGALIYNSSKSNAAVAVLDFGGNKTSTAGDFTIQFPAAGPTTAIIRIA